RCRVPNKPIHQKQLITMTSLKDDPNIKIHPTIPNPVPKEVCIKELTVMLERGETVKNAQAVIANWQLYERDRESATCLIVLTNTFTSIYVQNKQQSERLCTVYD